MKRVQILTATAILAFAVLFAGCAGGAKATGGEAASGGVDAAAAAGGAEKLAADLNALVAGSATLKNKTVTLAKDVTLTGALTIPEGATLAASKAGLNLGNNAVLTINGEFKARGGNEPDGVTNYALGISADAATPAEINGKGFLRISGPGYLIMVSAGKKLTLRDIKIDGLAGEKNKNWPDWVTVDGDSNVVPLIRVEGEGASLILAGDVIIAGNTSAWTKTSAESGGALLIYNSASCEMGDNAQIAGNWQIGNRYGGGVHVSGPSDKQEIKAATFILKDNASIWGNQCLPSDNINSRGGGVAVDNAATFTMQGNAKIYGNSANIGGGLYSGGYFARIILEGGTIYGVNERDASLRNNADVPLRGSSLHISTSGDAEKVVWGKSGTFTGGDGTKAPGSPILTGSTGAVYENGATKLGGKNILTQDTLIAKQ